MTDIAGERKRLAAVGFTHRLREQWDSRFDYRNDRPVDHPASRLFLHITVTNPVSYRSHDAHARAVEVTGTSRFPATGISYNELILPGGLLYEGQPLTRRGAHTVNDKNLNTCQTTGCPGRGTTLVAPADNLNVNARAIVLARNVNDPVTDLDVAAAARWGAAIKLAGYMTKDARWHGHRCVAFKDCPGDKGFARLDDISDLTATYVHNGLPGGEDVSATGPASWDAADWAALRGAVIGQRPGGEAVKLGPAATDTHLETENLRATLVDIQKELKGLDREPPVEPPPA